MIALGTTQCALLAAFGWLDGLSFPLPRLAWPMAAFACYGLAAWMAPGLESRRDLAIVWGLGVLMRLLLLPLAPELSDDVYRYLWDGHVQRAGVNPYLFPPAHEAVAHLRTSWHQLINHPNVPTIYPPLTQVVFYLAALMDRGILGAKLIWTGFELAAAWLVVRVARLSGRPVGPVLILYLWSPLLVVESAWSGHFDAVGLFWISALLLASRSAPRGGLRIGGLLAAATLTKFAPAAVLPVAVRRHGWTTALAFAALCLALYVPYASVGIGPLTEGLRTYSEHWTANEGAFWVIHELIPDPIRSRAVAGTFVLATVAYVTWMGFSLERALLWILGSGLLLSPTVHPWYVLWILPMAALRKSAPWLLLSGLVFLGYWGLGTYQATGIWPQPGWMRAVIWLPVWGLLLHDVLRLGRERPAVTDSTAQS